MIEPPTISQDQLGATDGTFFGFSSRVLHVHTALRLDTYRRGVLQKQQFFAEWSRRHINHQSTQAQPNKGRAKGHGPEETTSRAFENGLFFMVRMILVRMWTQTSKGAMSPEVDLKSTERQIKIRRGARKGREGEL